MTLITNDVLNYCVLFQIFKLGAMATNVNQCMESMIQGGVLLPRKDSTGCVSG